MKIVLMLTAKSRPDYLRESLISWANADDVNTLDGVVVALGRSDKEMEQRKLIREICPGARIWLDSDRAHVSNGMHTSIAEGASRVFAALKPDALILSEEDVVVSSDIIKYMKWAAQEFMGDSRVLLVNAHNRAGQGWDPHLPVKDEKADQNAVRLQNYMNAWCWLTWPDRWTKVIEPNWDYDCNKGWATTSGYDWQLQRVILNGEYLGVTPEASRSQNIGIQGGWASSEWSFAFSQSQSFRPKRDNPEYKLINGGNTLYTASDMKVQEVPFGADEKWGVEITDPVTGKHTWYREWNNKALITDDHLMLGIFSNREDAIRKTRAWADNGFSSVNHSVHVKEVAHGTPITHDYEKDGA